MFGVNKNKTESMDLGGNFEVSKSRVGTPCLNFSFGSRSIVW